MNTIDTSIDRWVDAGLMSTETAAELRRFEAEHAEQDTAAPAPTAASPSARTSDQPRALALVGEVVGYLGAILAITALVIILSRTWSDVPTAGRIALVAGLLAIVLAGGVLAARAAAAPAQRLATVLLAATAGLTGWLAFVVADDALGLAEHVTLRTVVVAVAATAVAVQLARPRGFSQVVALGSLAALAPALLQGPNREPDGTWVAAAWASLGIAWLALAIMGPYAPRLARLTEPRVLGLVAGGMLAVMGPQQAAWVEDYRVWALSTTVAVAAALIALSITRRDLGVLVVPGAIGLLMSVPQLIDHLVGDALATWLAVLATGIVLVLVAVWMVRRRRPAPPAASP